MGRDILKGLKISFGFFIGLSLFFGIVFAIGFHSADEILEGTFSGNFEFTGDVNLSAGDLYFQDGSKMNSSSSIGGIPSGGILNFEGDSCPLGYTNVLGLGLVEKMSDSLSSESTLGGYPLSNVLDGDLSTFWSTVDAGRPVSLTWIAFKFVNPVAINDIKIYPRSGLEYLLFKDFSVYGSIDSSNGADGTWTLLGSGFNTSNSLEWNEITFTNYDSYNWYKLVGDTQEHGASPSYIQIAEIDFYSSSLMCKKD